MQGLVLLVSCGGLLQNMSVPLPSFLCDGQAGVSAGALFCLCLVLACCKAYLYPCQADCLLRMLCHSDMAMVVTAICCLSETKARFIFATHPHPSGSAVVTSLTLA